jgi:hypothetical protein
MAHRTKGGRRTEDGGRRTEDGGGLFESIIPQLGNGSAYKNVSKLAPIL